MKRNQPMLDNPALLAAKAKMQRPENLEARAAKLGMDVDKYCRHRAKQLFQACERTCFHLGLPVVKQDGRLQRVTVDLPEGRVKVKPIVVFDRLWFITQRDVVRNGRVVRPEIRVEAEKAIGFTKIHEQ